jgi:hypothetical protein
MVGNLVDANSDRLFATLYLDDKATQEQSHALTRIVEYMIEAYVALPDQPPVAFNRHKRVPIRFDESSDRTHYSLEIPAILQEKAVLKRDKSGKPLFTMTAMDSWSNTDKANVCRPEDAGPAWRYVRFMDSETAKDHPRSWAEEKWGSSKDAGNQRP